MSSIVVTVTSPHPFGQARRRLIGGKWGGMIVALNPANKPLRLRLPEIRTKVLTVNSQEVYHVYQVIV